MSTAIPTTYTVYPTGADPESDNINLLSYLITIERRSPGRWAVCWRGSCLRHDGRRWMLESIPSSRTDRFKAAYRMSHEDALRLALAHVDKITSFGDRTWAEYGAWRASRQEAEL